MPDHHPIYAEELSLMDDVSMASPRSVVCVGLAQSLFEQLEDAWHEAPWPLRPVATPQEAYVIAEYEALPAAVLLRAGREYDPNLVMQILRANGVDAPIFVLCETTYETVYYASDESVGLHALTLPLDATQVQRIQSACRYAELVERAVAHAGVVDEIGLAQLMVSLHGQRYSGLLRLQREQTERTIHFLDGEPVYAESNLLSENFGQFLCSRGVISSLEYQQVQKLQTEKSIRQGEALVQIGVLTNQGLFELLREQIEAKVLNAFVSGETAFTLEETPDGTDQGKRFELRLIDVLCRGLMQTASPSQLDTIWASMAHKFLIAQPRGPELWPSKELLPPSVVERLSEGRALSELFGADIPMRDRVALVLALTIAELGVLVSEPPTGVRLGGWLADQHARSALFTVPPIEEVTDEEFEGLIGKYLQLQDSNHFNVLEVGTDASFDDIELAYKRLKAHYDPERFLLALGFEEQLSVINQRIDEAYEALAEPEHRTVHAASVAPQKQAAVTRRASFVDAEAAYELGLDLLDEGDSEGALEQFLAAQDRNPSEPLYQLYEGVTLAAMSAPGEMRWMQGKGLIARALARNPLMAHGHAVLGRVLAAEGDRDGAVDCSRMSLQLDAQCPEAHALLSDLGVSVDAVGLS